MTIVQVSTIVLWSYFSMNCRVKRVVSWATSCISVTPLQPYVFPQWAYTPFSSTPRASAVALARRSAPSSECSTPATTETNTIIQYAPSKIWLDVVLSSTVHLSHCRSLVSARRSTVDRLSAVSFWAAPERQDDPAKLEKDPASQKGTHISPPTHTCNRRCRHLGPL